MMTNVYEPDPQTMERVEDSTEHGPEGRGNYWCRLDRSTCTNSGPFDTARKRGSHEYQHRKKLEQAQPAPAKPVADEPEPPNRPAYTATEIKRLTGGLGWDILTEKAKTFAVALDAAVDSTFRPERRKQILEAFEDDSDQLTKDTHELENFLDDYGLSRAQQRQIVRRVIGRPRGQGSTGYGDGTQTVNAIDPRTGQMVPVIVISPQGAQHQPAAAPSAPFVIYPDSRNQGLTREDVVDLLDDYFQRREAARPAPSAPQPLRKYQEAVTDSEGNYLIDNEGKVVMRWVEEPVGAEDPVERVFSYLTRLERLKPAEQPTSSITMEDVRAVLREERDHGTPNLEGYQSRSEADLERRLAVMETKDEMTKTAREEIRAEVDSLTSKYDRELREYRTQGPADGTDFQAQLHHERGMLNDFKGGFTDLVESVRDDLKPLVKMVAAQNLRGMGITEQGVVDLLKAEQAGFNSAVEARRARQVEERWTQ